MIFISDNNNIHFNLALESTMIHQAKDLPILFLWRNSSCIVEGKFQNQWEECNMEAMKKDNVRLSRRRSGGGAVYQDLGNTCFTLIYPRGMWNKEKSFSIVTQALERLGIKTTMSGRNDILLNGFKVSGSAFQFESSIVSHHGTMLINENLDSVNKYLTPNMHKLKAKGVKSVSSRVANICQFYNITHEDFCNSMIEVFKEYFPESSKVLNASCFENDMFFKSEYEFFSSEKWLYCQTPDFSNVVSFYCKSGTFTFHFDVSDGILKKVKIFSDTLNVDLIPELESILTGIEYSKVGELVSGNSEVKEIINELTKRI